MTPRQQTARRVAVAALITLLGVGGGALFIHLERERSAEARTEAELIVRANEIVAQRQMLASRIEAAKTMAEWEEIAALASKLPAPEGSIIARRATLHRLNILSEDRDELLRAAGRVHRVNEEDPAILDYVTRAKAIHQKIAEELSGIKDLDGPCGENASFWSLKGYERYRSTVFFAENEKEKTLSAIKAAIVEYRNVLECLPKDRTTEESLEFLYQKQKQEGSGAGGGGKKPYQPQLLPQGSQGIGIKSRPGTH